jgi:hypothetical protein
MNSSEKGQCFYIKQPIFAAILQNDDEFDLKLG